jgi:hypothetical protein
MRQRRRHWKSEADRGAQLVATASEQRASPTSLEWWHHRKSSGDRAHESPRLTKLYDRTSDEITLRVFCVKSRMLSAGGFQAAQIAVSKNVRALQDGLQNLYASVRIRSAPLSLL